MLTHACRVGCSDGLPLSRDAIVLFLGSVSMFGLRLESWSCWSMEGTLKPQKWEGKRGMDQFSKLQKRKFGLQEKYPCGSTVKCWGWPWGGRS